jgi:hypothetical protein
MTEEEYIEMQREWQNTNELKCFAHCFIRHPDFLYSFKDETGWHQMAICADSEFGRTLALKIEERV